MIQLFKAKSLKNNTKKNLKYSSKEKSKGRSMVEMLGVLAIIGVLSIGGISGYTLAMRRYKINEIMNIANKYALTLYTSCQQAMMNDPKRYWVAIPTRDSDGSVYAIWRCPAFPSFNDAGLGSLPNGSLQITPNGIRTIFNNDDIATYQEDHEIIVSKHSEGQDSVTLSIQFDSQTLCETACSAFNLEYCNCTDKEIKRSGCSISSHWEDDKLVCAEDEVIPKDSIANTVFIEN